MGSITTFKVDPAKTSRIKEALKARIFRSKRLTAEEKLDFFHQCIEDIDNAQEFHLIDGKALCTTLEKDGTRIMRTYNLSKCRGLRLFSSAFNNCMVEMTIEPDGFAEGFSEEDKIGKTLNESPFELSVWNIYTPSIYTELEKRVSKKPFRESVFGETEKIYV